MKFLHWIASLLLGFSLVTACRQAESPDISSSATNAAPNTDWAEPKAAQPKLPTIKVWIGAEQLVTEMALSAREQQTGMMFRRSIGENEAMIFVFPFTRQASFWMKNCYIPLSVAYIDPDGVIQEIHDLQPHNTQSVISAGDNIRFALETSQGWFARHNVTTGMTVRTEKGSLMETFNLKP